MHTRHTQHIAPLSLESAAQHTIHVRKTIPNEHPLGVATRSKADMSEADTAAESQPLVVSHSLLVIRVCNRDNLL
jgi:hypothetical protein